MATQIQRRRGTTAQHSTFTGALGELTVDTDKKTVVVHDGITAGGFPLAVASKYAPLASPALTGTPTAPTAAAGTNTTQIATTAFVQSEKPSAATQAEMEAGTGAGIRSMSPLGVAQAIAAKSSGGIRGQVFTSSDTFTVPAGVTAVKVRGCGGGGASATSDAGGSNGGTTSFGSYCSATGGNNGPSGSGGTATGGDLNITGGAGTYAGSGMHCTGGSVGGARGGFSTTASTILPAAQGILGVYGCGAESTTANGHVAASGGAGGYFEKYITGLTPGDTITVTIGAGGYSPGKASGAPGICIVEW